MTKPFFTREHLTALDAALKELPQSGLPMTLSEMNGFLTGVQVNPETIMPSEWLPWIWGDDPIVAFEAMKDPEATTDLIIDHYNTVSGMLANEAHYEAIFIKDVRFPEERPWMPWIEGFMRSIELAPRSWDILTPERDRKAEAALELLYLLDDMTSNVSVFPKDRIDEISKQAPDLIRTCVVRLNRFTKSMKSDQAPLAEDVPTQAFTSNVVPFPGKQQERTDLCACGSGRTYEHCCGSN